MKVVVTRLSTVTYRGGVTISKRQKKVMLRAALTSALHIPGLLKPTVLPFCKGMLLDAALHLHPKSHSCLSESV